MQGADNWSNGKYFELTNDITDTVRIPIESYFEGHFDGNEYTVTIGMTNSIETNATALFGWVGGGFTIQNLIVDGYSIGTGGAFIMRVLLEM